MLAVGLGVLHELLEGLESLRPPRLSARLAAIRPWRPTSTPIPVVTQDY
jgi:hypothetical protein